MNCMICPVCGSFIRLKDDEGICDYCMTFISKETVFEDPDYVKEEKHEKHEISFRREQADT